MRFRYSKTRILQQNILLVIVPKDYRHYESSIISQLNDIDPDREIVIIVAGENNITYSPIKKDSDYKTLCAATMTLYLKPGNNLVWNNLDVVI